MFTSLFMCPILPCKVISSWFILCESFPGILGFWDGLYDFRKSRGGIFTMIHPRGGSGCKRIKKKNCVGLGNIENMWKNHRGILESLWKVPMPKPLGACISSDVGLATWLVDTFTRIPHWFSTYYTTPRVLAHPSMNLTGLWTMVFFYMPWW